RLPLPSALRWIEIDHPGLIQWKDGVLRGERAACAVERIALDLAAPSARKDLFARVGAETERVLVVTEGGLAYLEEADVAEIADDLHRAFPTALWLLENVAPHILLRQRRMWDKTLRAANAEMKFAPTEGLSFFRAHGFTPKVTRSLMDEAARLGR